MLALGALVSGLGVAVHAGESSAAMDRSTSRVVISTLQSSRYGTLLVSGTTVYTLKPSNVLCATKCLQIWPEVLLPKGATKAVAGHGVNAARLGTIKRPGGRLQVSYAGKALYWFYKDKAPGQVNGVIKDTWGSWSDVVLVKPAGGGSTTTTTTGGGGGGIGF